MAKQSSLFGEGLPTLSANIGGPALMSLQMAEKGFVPVELAATLRALVPHALILVLVCVPLALFQAAKDEITDVTLVDTLPQVDTLHVDLQAFQHVKAGVADPATDACSLRMLSEMSAIVGEVAELLATLSTVIGPRSTVQTHVFLKAKCRGQGEVTHLAEMLPHAVNWDI